jgi:hypothetical protein
VGRRNLITAFINYNGRVIIEPRNLENHWRDYIEQLFHDQRKSHASMGWDGPDILPFERLSLS